VAFPRTGFGEVLSSALAVIVCLAGETLDTFQLATQLVTFLQTCADLVSTQIFIWLMPLTAAAFTVIVTFPLAVVFDGWRIRRLRMSVFELSLAIVVQVSLSTGLVDRA
jgi:hypothetical protein